MLEREEMIKQARDSKKTLLTIIKYGDYQDSRNSQVTVKEHSRNAQVKHKELTRNSQGNKQGIKEGIKEDIKKKEEETAFDPDDYVYDFATTDVDDDDW